MQKFSKASEEVMKILHNQSIRGDGVIFSGFIRVRVEEGFRFSSSHLTMRKRKRLNSKISYPIELGAMN